MAVAKVVHQQSGVRDVGRRQPAGQEGATQAAADLGALGMTHRSPLPSNPLVMSAQFFDYMLHDKMLAINNVHPFRLGSFCKLAVISEKAHVGIPLLQLINGE